MPLAADIFRHSDGAKLCRVVFREAAPKANLSRPDTPGKVEIKAEDPLIAFEMMAYFEAPHPQGTRAPDGTFVDGEVAPGTVGHFGLRLSSLPAIGYRGTLVRKAKAKAKGKPPPRRHTSRPPRVRPDTD